MQENDRIRASSPKPRLSLAILFCTSYSSSAGAFQVVFRLVGSLSVCLFEQKTVVSLPVILIACRRTGAGLKIIVGCSFKAVIVNVWLQALA